MAECDESFHDSYSPDINDGVAENECNSIRQEASIQEPINLSSNNEPFDESSKSNYFQQDHFINMLTTKQTETSKTNYDAEYNSSLRLIELLIKKNIPVSHYDDFIKWKYLDDNRNRKPLSFDKIIEMTTKKIYGNTLAENMKPKIINVELPSGRYCYVIAFDCSTMIFDMLNSKFLTTTDNMIFMEKNGNPFHIKPSEEFNDIDTSLLYLETFKDLKINVDEEVLCPLGIFIDELKLDAFGKMGLEPVVLTLLIYNRQTRNNHKSHRVIGYMPNFQMLFPKAGYSATEKANDYHQCLAIILKDVKNLQRRDGLYWDFKFENHKDQIFRRRLLFPLFYVIGDAKGNDMLVGRYGTYNSRCIARDCDVLKINSDDPYHDCTFHQEKIMNKLSERELNNLSFRKIQNHAFCNIWFGSQPYGRFAAFPPEPLHMFNLGIIERLAESFISRLGPDEIQTLDRHVAYNCTYHSKQSDRSYPTMETFMKGISEASKLSAREKLARIWCIYLTLLTVEFQQEVLGKEGRHINPNMNGVITINEYNRWLYVFEQTMLFSSWIYLEKHPKIFFKGGRQSIVAKRIVQFMAMYKIHAPRQEGNGLKILKFHQLLHLWWVIRLFGSMLNVDGARGECNNRYLAKNLAKCTQKQHDSLPYQTAIKTFQHNAILSKIEAEVTIEQLSEIQKSREKIYTSSGAGSKFLLMFDYSSKICKCNWLGHKLKRSCKFPLHVLKAIYTKLENYNAGEVGRRIISVTGFTEYILNDTDKSLIRCCPSFRGAHDWHDWVRISWQIQEGGVSSLSAQILMMLDMASMGFEAIDNNEAVIAHEIIPHRLAALVHSVDEARPKKKMPIKGGNGFTSQLATWHNMEKEYQLVNIQSILSKCFVLVNTHNNPDGRFCCGFATKVINILPKPLWSNKFIDYDDRRLIANARSATDRNVVDEDLQLLEN